jgi:hypothetical protein
VLLVCLQLHAIEHAAPAIDDMNHCAAAAASRLICMLAGQLMHMLAGKLVFVLADIAPSLVLSFSSPQLGCNNILLPLLLYHSCCCYCSVLGSSVSGAFNQAEIVTDVATGSVAFTSTTPVNLTVQLGGITTVVADVPAGMQHRSCRPMNLSFAPYGVPISHWVQHVELWNAQK